jgi:NADH-ubiquinone oxidoreductase chain 5
MLLAVLIVSTLVHVYSASYMENDCHVQRFMSYLSFFTASIVLLVTGDNLLVMFLGWEFIGIASYLLIGFWLTRVQANKAAVKAMTINRVGDAIMSVGFFTLL